MSTSPPRPCGDFAAQKQRLSTDLPAGEVAAACDPVRVVQIVSNLVSNALKYSPADSHVAVRLTVDAGQAHISVIDEGRGIPADQLERIFDKFHRVEDPMRMTTAGTGLGLFIAQQLAEAMGGSLSVSSTLGVGSTFTFSLPVPAEGPPEGQAEGPAAGQAETRAAGGHPADAHPADWHAARGQPPELTASIPWPRPPKTRPPKTVPARRLPTRRGGRRPPAPTAPDPPGAAPHPAVDNYGGIGAG